MHATLTGRVVNATVDDYGAFLTEHYRPPSRGGNTSALHSHALTIQGVKYTFLARGSRKWVYVGDRVSFDWELKDGKYHNIVKSTIETIDKNGKPIVRGDRRWKPTLRSAPMRDPHD